MRKYADIPMDFADATLVLLSEELKVAEIVTLDRRGFSTYRIAQRKPFHLVLDSLPAGDSIYTRLNSTGRTSGHRLTMGRPGSPPMGAKNRFE